MLFYPGRLPLPEYLDSASAVLTGNFPSLWISPDQNPEDPAQCPGELSLRSNARPTGPMVDNRGILVPGL